MSRVFQVIGTDRITVRTGREIETMDARLAPFRQDHPRSDGASVVHLTNGCSCCLSMSLTPGDTLLWSLMTRHAPPMPEILYLEQLIN